MEDSAYRGFSGLMSPRTRDTEWQQDSRRCSGGCLDSGQCCAPEDRGSAPREALAEWTGSPGRAPGGAPAVWTGGPRGSLGSVDRKPPQDRGKASAVWIGSHRPVGPRGSPGNVDGRTPGEPRQCGQEAPAVWTGSPGSVDRKPPAGPRGSPGSVDGRTPGKPRQCGQEALTGPRERKQRGHFAAVCPSTLNFILLFS